MAGGAKGGEGVSEDAFAAAVAAGVSGSAERYQQLLASIVEVARSIFEARASSILLLDEESQELVFAAVVGEGEESLLGRRFPAATGIAGWVLTTRTPVVIDEVASDPRFDRPLAESSGYVPRGLMAVPLQNGEQALGVLEVLDRPQQSRFTLAEMTLLELFAAQASIALDLLQRARRAEAVLSGKDAASAVARLARTLDGLEDSARPAALRLLDDLDEILRNRG
jgi:GAF domain-containing protein